MDKKKVKSLKVKDEEKKSKDVDHSKNRNYK